MEITYKKLIGKQILDYLEDIAALRIIVFKEFPYLYDGNLDYEKKYLTRYANANSSLIILAIKDDKIIGASSCISIEEETDEFKSIFKNKSYDLSRIFYFGESIILKEFRGNKIGSHFFKLREEHAKLRISNLKYTCFCAVDRELDHPLRPSEYRPLDEFWRRLDYSKTDMKVRYSWKDIDMVVEDNKSMSVWLKCWS